MNAMNDLHRSMQNGLVLGQAVGAGLRGHQQNKLATAKNEAITAGHKQNGLLGAANAAYETGDFELGSRLQGMWQQLKASDKENVSAAANEYEGYLGKIWANTDDPQLRQQASAKALMAVARKHDLPPEKIGELAPYLTNPQIAGAILTQQPEEYTLSEGAQRWRGGEMVAENVKDTAPPSPSASSQKYQELVALGLPEEEARAAAYDLQGNDLPDFKDVQSLRKEITQNASTFRDVTTSYENLQAAAAQNSAAGDVSMVFAYMKMLDPISVVRESEQATAQNAAGVPERIRNIYNRLINGERLTENQRKDFLEMGGRLYDVASAQHQRLSEAYGVIADRYQIDRSLVELPFGSENPPTPILDEQFAQPVDTRTEGQRRRDRPNPAEPPAPPSGYTLDQ